MLNLQPRPTRTRTCVECGKVETVRRDNHAPRCRECGSVPGAVRGAAVIKARFPTNQCICGKEVRGSRIYCSVECTHAGKRTPTVQEMAIPEFPVVSELELSRAAEFLVAADLTLRGFPAHIGAAGLPYDVLVDVGPRMLRVQVKATRGPRRIPQRAAYTPGYLFQLRRAGTGGKRLYADGAFDCYALVALDTREIAYMPMAGAPQTLHLRPSGYVPVKWARKIRSITEFPWTACLSQL